MEEAADIIPVDKLIVFSTLGTLRSRDCDEGSSDIQIFEFLAEHKRQTTTLIKTDGPFPDLGAINISHIGWYRGYETWSSGTDSMLL